MYVYKTSKVIMFSSEIKSFTVHPDFKSEINANHIDEYLFLGIVLWENAI